MISENTYRIDYKRLVMLLLPTFLRQGVLVGLVYSCVYPLDKLLNRLIRMRSDNVVVINRNGQVCHLRGLLNDELDPDERRIRIVDGDPSDCRYLYREDTFNSVDAGVPLMAGQADTSSVDEYGNTLFVFNEGNTGITLVDSSGAIGSSGYDFVVQVPMSLRGVLDQSRIIALTNYFKLASKRYKIQYYE